MSKVDYRNKVLPVAHQKQDWTSLVNLNLSID